MGLLDAVVTPDLMDEVQKRFKDAMLDVLLNPDTRRTFMANVSARGDMKRDPRMWYNDDIDDAAWHVLFTAPLADRRGFVVRNIGTDDLLITAGTADGPFAAADYDLLVPGAVEDYPFDEYVVVWILAITATTQAGCGYEYK